jgi:hypothetical protein
MRKYGTPFCIKKQCNRQHQTKPNLIKLRRMPMNPIAEIHAPRQTRRDPVGMIRQAFQKTSDSSDAQADQDWEYKSVPGRSPQAGQSFGDFHAEPSTSQSPCNCFPAQPRTRIGLSHGGVLVDGFNKCQGFGADNSAKQAADDDPQSAFIAEFRSRKFLAEKNKKLRAGKISGKFHYLMRMD